MKVGLVLEGGAMRGMYTAGVLDTFMDYKIEVDTVVGVSAGALFGVNYVSGQKGRTIRYNKRFNADKNYLGILPFLREGNIVDTKYAYYDVPHKLDPFDNAAFMKSPVKFYAVVTNIQSGKAEYIHIKNAFAQMDLLRASGSLPFLSRPVEYLSQKYLDGAVADSVPFEWLGAQGFDKLIVVLTRDSAYHKSPINKMLCHLFYRHYPQFEEALANRHNMYNAQMDRLLEWEREGKLFAIRPSRDLEMKRIETRPERLQAMYDLGIEDCLERMPALKRYLNRP